MDHITTLPSELLVTIFSYFQYHDVQSITSTCHTLHSYGAPLHLHPRGIDTVDTLITYIGMLGRSYRHIASIDLTDCNGAAILCHQGWQVQVTSPTPVARQVYCSVPLALLLPKSMNDIRTNTVMYSNNGYSQHPQRGRDLYIFNVSKHIRRCHNSSNPRQYVLYRDSVVPVLRCALQRGYWLVPYVCGGEDNYQYLHQLLTGTDTRVRHNVAPHSNAAFAHWIRLLQPTAHSIIVRDDTEGAIGDDITHYYMDELYPIAGIPVSDGYNLYLVSAAETSSIVDAINTRLEQYNMARVDIGDIGVDMYAASNVAYIYLWSDTGEGGDMETLIESITDLRRDMATVGNLTVRLLWYDMPVHNNVYPSYDDTTAAINRGTGDIIDVYAPMMNGQPTRIEA